jgi:hypothetical protein
MDRNLTEICSETLARSTNVIAYDVTRRMTELYPDQYLLFNANSAFDLDEFVTGGHCRATLNPEMLALIQTQYIKTQGLAYSAINAWYDVDWQEHTLKVLALTWQTGYCETTHYWIVAANREVAERFFWDVCEWASDVRGEVLVFEDGYWNKSRSLFEAIRNSSFDNLVLPDRLKQEIQDDFAQFFASREVYERHGVPWKRGVLLIGPPGNGKSHTVKALVNWLDAPCLYVKSFLSERRNDQRNVKTVFDRARQTTPCILVMEDLDSLIHDGNRAFFLNELDGFAANTGILVLATTNHPERLDPAILNRPSRFDRKYHFELPAVRERERYIAAWNDSLEPALRLTFDGVQEVADATEGFSFAYLKELFLSSMMRWIARPGLHSMEQIMSEQRHMLREQMTQAVDEPVSNILTDEEEDD